MSYNTRRRSKAGPSSKLRKSVDDDGPTVLDLPVLRRKRTIAFNRLKKTLEVAELAKQDRTQVDVFLAHYAVVQKLSADFEGAHFDILSVVDSESEIQEDWIREEFDNIYFNIATIHRQLIRSNDHDRSFTSNVKLPKITIPTFSGSLKSWPEFYDIFNSLVHNNESISDTERMHYLVSSLSGDAHALIRTYPIQGVFYQEAYNTLIARYQDKRELAFLCWKEILNIHFKSNSPLEFRRVLDLMSENLQILQGLDLPTDKWDFILCYHILSKLDSKTRCDYEESHTSSEMPKYKELLKYLYSKCEALVRDTHFLSQDHLNGPSYRTNDKSKTPSKTNKSFKSKPTSVFLSNTNESEPKPQSDQDKPNSDQSKSQSSSASGTPYPLVKCSFCLENHSVSQCKRFAQTSVTERIEHAKNNRWCFNCLKPSHSVKDCRSIFRCQKCRHRHHSLLHQEQSENTAANAVPIQGSSGSQNDSQVRVLTSLGDNSVVLLSTAIVQVRDSSGSFQPIRALIDSGSQGHFITESAAKRLGVDRTLTSRRVHGLGISSSAVSGMVSIGVGVNDQNLFQIDAFTLPTICCKMPSIRIDKSSWHHLHGLKLADPDCHLPGPIDLLLGAEVFASLLLPGSVSGGRQQPSALNSVFGWLLTGSVGCKEKEINSFFNSFLITEDNNQQDDVKCSRELDQFKTSKRLTPDEEKSGDNPADIVSRGQLQSALVNNRLWWAGPSCLSQPTSSWPRSDEVLEQISLESKEKSPHTLFTHETQPVSFIDTLLERYSSIRKIQRILCVWIKFVDFIRNKRTCCSDPIPNRTELHNALMVIVRHIQSTHFESEIRQLKAGDLLSKQMRKLNPFLDRHGVLRVGGRLARSGLEFEHKHPALLPRESRLTYMIIDSIHRENCHAGVNTMQYLLTQQFWILSPKRAIRRCLSKCVQCYKTKPIPLEPYMSDLPATRVNQVKPFSIVGTDYGGPFRIKLAKHRGAKTGKAYLCLFVCFSTKAVHLETVSDLSSEAFLAALRRFVSRRGRVSIIQSDCGTNYVGGSNYLNSLMQSAAQTENIEFRFNPPLSPHFGGVWEIQIKSVKSHLYRIIGEQALTFEELSTVFIQIEAMLNSRPLCPLSSDPNDLSVLTPGHFLKLEPLTSVPDEDLTSININRLGRWQLIQRFQQDFWNRWKLSKPLNVGSVVILKNDNFIPLHWPLARVEKLHTSPDGVARIATIRTGDGSRLTRPLAKLCPLPNQIE